MDKSLITLVEHLGISGVLAGTTILLIYKFVSTDKKVEAMHRRFDSLKKEIEEVMTEIKDDIHELNKDLLRNFRNGGGRG
tara:strand:- start:1354 stop:1593 length:240 start_codon:yes stop_codon:yes gene_type:complete